MFREIARSILYKAVELSLNRNRPGDGKKKVLIVRIDGIGDLVLFSPFLPSYRMLWPDCHITLMVNEQAMSIAERYTGVDDVMPFDRARFGGDLMYRRKVLNKVRSRRFDVVVYPVYSREQNGDDIVRLSGAGEKIGFDGNFDNIPVRDKSQNDRYYTKLIPAQPGTVIEIERNRAFLEGLGIKADAAIPSFSPSKEDESEAGVFLRRNGLKNTDPFAVICPGAGHLFKTWPPERYASTAAILKRRHGLEIVICGSANEGPLARKIMDASDVPVIDGTGETTLPVLAALLKKSVLYIGSDTAAVHLASSVGTPAVCIVGGGHFGRFFPYGDVNKNRIVCKKMDCFGCNWRCIYDVPFEQPFPCIADITVEDVRTVTENALTSGGCGGHDGNH